MSSIKLFKQLIQLKPREVLGNDKARQVWQVTEGALRIDNYCAPDSLRFIRLALPGDILGLEQLAGEREPDVARAITKVSLTQLYIQDDHELAQLFRDALIRHHRRCRETASLRIGTVEERVRRLLLLIAYGKDDFQSIARLLTIPSLVNIASIINAAPETVSRIVSGLRESGFLQEERRQQRLSTLVRQPVAKLKIYTHA